MPHFPRSRVALLVASLSLSCAGPDTSARPTTMAVARSDDPWLVGEPCTPETPSEPAPRIEVLAPGSRPPVGPGMTVRVHYVASLPTGEVLHDTHAVNIASEIILGSTRMICGLERGLMGMRPGEERRVVVPASLAFGEQGRPPEIPPSTPIVFDVELYLPSEVVNQPHSAPVNPMRGGGRRR